MLRKTQIHFFFLAAQTAQTEEFMFQNVAYRPTVYRTGFLKHVHWTRATETEIDTCLCNLIRKNTSKSKQQKIDIASILDF